MAVDQLNRCSKPVLEDETQKAKVCKLNLEAAEIAITKTAFRTAVEYLESGLTILDHLTRWTARHYENTLRTFLILARMRLCCGRLESAKAACERIFHGAVSLKDQIHANHVYFIIHLQEGKPKKALNRVMDLLKEMGEHFPTGDPVESMIFSEVRTLRDKVRARDAKKIMNPPRMQDRKMVDVMSLLAVMWEVSSHQSLQPNPYQDLAMIRMMHISLSDGFTRQYPLALAVFSTFLAKKRIFKEAMRIGQMAEKMARMSDYYGSHCMAMFYWHTSHWRRPYIRDLEPSLNIYNAQLYTYFMRAYVAFFFHEVELMEFCLKKISKPMEGIRTLWEYMLQCIVLIHK